MLQDSHLSIEILMSFVFQKGLTTDERGGRGCEETEGSDPGGRQQGPTRTGLHTNLGFGFSISKSTGIHGLEIENFQNEHCLVLGPRSRESGLPGQLVAEQ